MLHTITLQPSGHAYSCGPDTAVLKAGLDAGLFLPYSCRSGVCKTCRGKVLQGKVDFGPVHPQYLSDADRAAGYALLCCAKPLGDVVIEVQEIDAGDAIKSKFMPVRILKSEKVAPDVMVVTLGLPMNEPLVFRAGQYVEFVRKDGSRRNYSIANPPRNNGLRQLELHVRLMPGGQFTDYVFNRMQVRDVHRIEVPLGSFFLREKSDLPMVMLASGTGFAPIKSMIEYSLNKGLKRPITLYWGGRRREDLYMMALAEKWAAEHAHISFVPVLSEPAPGCQWKGRQGLVHQAAMADFPDMRGIEVYACGAPVVINAARRDFAALCGLPDDAFYADSFLTTFEKTAA